MLPSETLTFPPFLHAPPPLYSHLGLLLPLQHGLDLPQVLEELLVQLALLVRPVAQQGVRAHEEVVKRQVRKFPLVGFEPDPVEENDSCVTPTGRDKTNRQAGYEEFGCVDL